MHRAGAGRLVRQEPEAPAPPVGRAPPPASGSVRSVMRAETLQPPTGARAQKSARSRPPPARSRPTRRPSVWSPAPLAPSPHPDMSQHHAGAAPNVMRANTVRVSATRCADRASPEIQAAFRGPSTPSLSSPLRAPSGPQVMFFSWTPTARPRWGWFRPRPAVASGPASPPRPPTAPTPRARPPTACRSSPPRTSRAARARRPRARARAAARPERTRSDGVSEHQSRAREAPLTDASAAGGVAPEHPLSGLHRSAVVLGGSIVLAALIFTVGQVYVARAARVARRGRRAQPRARRAHRRHPALSRPRSNSASRGPTPRASLPCASTSPTRRLGPRDRGAR